MIRVLVIVASFAMLCSCATLTREEIHSRGNLGDRQALVGWLGDDRSWVREEAARSLGRTRDVESRELLEARAADVAEKTWVRAAAADALGEIGDRRSMPLLVGLAAQPGTPSEVKIALVRAMCGVAADEALSSIAPLASNEDLLVSAFASAQLASSCGRVSR